MPRLDRGNSAVSSSGGGARGRYNPNIIIPWNCVRFASDEFAVVRMLSPVTDSPLIDVAAYHSHRAIVDGKQQFRYVYCTTKNVYADDDGRERQIAPGDCDLCKSQDDATRTTRPRYNMWTFCYGIYHTNQNPRFGKYDDAEEWEQRKVGSRHFYREAILKPQVLQAPQTVINIFTGYEERLGQEKFAATTFDLMKRGVPHSIQYTGYETQVSLPDIEDDIQAIIGELPDIEKVSAELITEWEFPTLYPEGDSRTTKDEDAFAAAGGDF